MNRDELVERLSEMRSDFHAEGVSRMFLFGSRARGDHTDQSDIDLLLEVKPDARFSILNLVGVEHLVQDRIGIPANAFLERSLDEDFIKSIEADLIRVF